MATAKTTAQKAATTAQQKKPAATKVVCTTCASCATREKAMEQQLQNEKNTLTPAQQQDLDNFKAHYAANEAHYQSLATQTGVPAPLIAALHWRESEGDFNTYLANGQALGKTTTIVPKGMTFQKGQFDQAAQQATKLEQSCQTALGMTKDTTDRAKIAAYAEHWNGLGYAEHGMTSPYVFAGTNQYTSGLYTSDGVLSTSTVDGRPGVMPLYDSVAGP